MSFSNFIERLQSLPDPTMLVKRDLEPGLIFYGAGKMGRMAYELSSRVGIFPKYFVDQNAVTRIEDIQVLSPEQVPVRDKLEMLVVICVVTSSYSVLVKQLQKDGFKRIVHFYDLSELCFSDLMPNGWYFGSLKKSDINFLENIYNKISFDKFSSDSYERFAYWRVKRFDSTVPVLDDQFKYLNESFFPSLGSDESLLDAGAHHGDFIERFLRKVNSSYSKVIAFEPDCINRSVLQSKINGRPNIQIYPYALGDKKSSNIAFSHGLNYASRITHVGGGNVDVITLDSLFVDQKISFMKFHIEGAELPALRGAVKTIERNRPIIMVWGDHSPDGLINIPNFLLEIPDSKLHFRSYDSCGNTAIYFLIPNERLMHAV